jgi:fatty-acyl-CoA synthase
MMGTMQDFPLTVASILRHGRTIYGESRVVTLEEGGRTRTKTFAEVAARAEQLAGALRELGIRPGDRVGTFAWNTQEHVEAYLAVPSMGAVLHTLNIRLFPEQLAWVINHAEDKAIVVEDTLIPVLAKVLPELKTVRHFIIIGKGDAGPLPRPLRYEELLAAQREGFPWPDVDERSAAAMCYTSGTTGNPKGVVYSHRSTWLHSLAICTKSIFGLDEHDRLLPIVPMFHANAWGTPYSCWLAGADLIMPGRFLQPEPLCRFIEKEKPTISAAVPAIWNGILQFADAHPVDLSSLKMVICGGSAVPRALIEAFQVRHSVRIVQAWGMTEMSPLGAIAHPPRGSLPGEEVGWRSKTGRVAPGVELRLIDGSGRVVPWDGESVGEIQARGPWVTASYASDPSPEKFDNGWLRTGDVGSIDRRGFIQITDRAKDVIKSGGEWISSVELENTLMAHPAVLEAAVISVHCDKWGERPLACVVKKPGATVDAQALRDFLESRVARFWLPERWAFIAEVPKTSVGKFDKKVLRSRFTDGKMESVTVGSAKGSAD